jgi:Fe-S cluster assembly ATPase SufC
MSSNSVLELRDVSVRRGERVILGPLNFSIQPGERWVVLGPNGAGKSTLLQILATRAFPTTGKVLLLGQEMGRVDLWELRTRIGICGALVSEDIPYEEKVRDVVRFLNDALSGEKVAKQYDTFNVDGFRLGIRPEVKPQILVAALREGMLRLAAREADGAIINWLSPEDVVRVAEVVRNAAEGTPKEIVARIFVCPSENTEVVRAAARFAIAAYLNVPVYAQFHAWLGRGDELKGMWDMWKAGDRKAALAAIPDEVVDQLIVHGSTEYCRDRIRQYFDNGVTTSSLAIMPFDPELNYWDAVKSLSPSAH